MEGGASRSQARHSRLPQGHQQDAGASKGAEPPPSHRARSPASGDLARDATPLQPRKRQLDAASADEPLPAKRARWTRTGTHTEPSTRSARLRTRRHSADSVGPIIAPSTPREPQIEAGAGTLASERPGLTKGNTQPGAEDEQTEQAAKIVQQLKPPKREDASPLEPNVEGQEQVSPATRLTRKNLALFNKMGAKKGTNKTNKTSASAPPDSTDESSGTKTTSTTTSGFAIRAYENGILHPTRSKPPKNLEGIRERVAGSRETASPPESVYENYVQTVSKAYNEITMVVEVSGKLLKEYGKEGYHREFNQAFTSFPKDAGFNNGLSVPQPDFVEGLEMEEFDPFPVYKYIEGAVLYKDDTNSVTLPHLAGEYKARGKNMEEARLQSAYNGAALVYTRNQALSYLGTSDDPNHAEITTFTTDGTTLNQYAHYAAPSEDGKLKYHQYPISSINLTSSYQVFKEGRRSLRNAQDYAKEQSYALRDQLKERWKQHRSGLHPIAEGAPLPVADGTSGETNADEDEADEVVEVPCQPTPAASSKPHRGSSSVSSPKSLPRTNDHTSSSRSRPPANEYVPDGGGQKRRASSSSASSRESSRHKDKKRSYWELDDRSDRYFHQHSDGRVTWKDDTS